MFTKMSGNNSVPSVPRPKRIVTASGKLTDPHNTVGDLQDDEGFQDINDNDVFVQAIG